MLSSLPDRLMVNRACHAIVRPAGLALSLIIVSRLFSPQGLSSLFCGFTLRILDLVLFSFLPSFRTHS
jgi:hypothetical protein